MMLFEGVRVIYYFSNDHIVCFAHPFFFERPSGDA